MKRFLAIIRRASVISLCLGVIWLCPVYAATAPSLTPLGVLQAPGMVTPWAMDLDAAGNLYVADVDSGSVYRFDKFNNLTASYALNANGLGLAVKADGSGLFVSQKGGSVAIVNPATGEQVALLSGSNASGPEFGAAGEIDIDAAGEYAYVADLSSRMIKVYHVSGGYQAQFGGAGTTDGKFYYIGGMALAPSGKLVVADSNALNFKVHILALSTAFQVTNATAYANTSTTAFGTELSSPRGIAFDDQGRGYFLDFIRSELRVVDVSAPAYTHLLTYGTGLKAVGDVVYDAASKRLFVSCDGGRIVVLGVDGGSNPQKVNHAPTAPVPQSPVGGSVVATATPELVINNATDEDGDPLTYQVVVRKGEEIAFQATVPAAAGATTSVVVSGAALEENATFSWTVQASDGEMSSAVSASAAFVVNAFDEAPGVPVLITPLGGEPMTGLDALIWGASSDPDPNDRVLSYRVEFARGADFVDAFGATVNETSLVLGALADYADLVDGATYFWRVAALDSDLTASAASAAGSFTYDTTVLTIAANMPGAQVFLSGNHGYAGRSVGTAPLELRDMSAGSYSVVVERDGFERFVAQVTLEDGANVDLYAALVPALNVSEFYSGRNSINGKSGLSVKGPAAPFLVDFDNDGQLDLLVGDADGQIQLFPNMTMVDRKLTFQPGIEVLRVYEGAIPYVADWNNDGRKDLVVGLASGFVKLFLNKGQDNAPAFDADGVVLLANGAALQVAGKAAPAVVDYDGDGNKDLVVGSGNGSVMLYLNQGGDDEPKLAGGLEIAKLASAVVPAPVDWDADGGLDLLLTSNGEAAIYRLTGGVYSSGPSFNERRMTFAATFPVALDNTGKGLLVGMADGSLAFLAGKSDILAASFTLALRDKTAELAELVTDSAALNAVNNIDTLIAAGNLVEAKSATALLLSTLPAGAAKTSAAELHDLL